MVKIHNFGYPRIGARRELKSALENYWRGDITVAELEAVGTRLRETNCLQQASLDFVPAGDFSFYDHVLDTSFLLGNIPDRAFLSNEQKISPDLDQYFRIARGRAHNDDQCGRLHAGEMTKWFDTNYHYIVPEFDAETSFKLNAERLLHQIKEAQIQLAQGGGTQVKPTLIGPVTYLYLGKSQDATDRLDLLDKLLPVYHQLLSVLADNGVEWVQIDEPILVTELNSDWRAALQRTYQELCSAPINILIATYFGQLKSNTDLLLNLPVQGIHLDTLTGRSGHASDDREIKTIVKGLSSDKVLSLGVVNGRNIWVTDLHKTLDWLQPIYDKLQNRLWLAPSCSLLHVPLDTEVERNHKNSMDPELLSWLAFAKQRIQELSVLAQSLKHGRDAVALQLADNARVIASRKNSGRVTNAGVQSRLQTLRPESAERNSVYKNRAEQQKKTIILPLYPTTTIGSFPQTPDIRKVRRDYKIGKLSELEYQTSMRNEIDNCVAAQERLGLDVLVHGEAERNDMVEYFGEQLEGYMFTKFAWVQSYGSRCVKPPIIYGDIYRPKPMTVHWTKYAQSRTDKPMKGMLTGPVTMLNWSFVRDDQTRADTCLQLALAIRDEVVDLEQAGINIIQIDEAALREGLPLRESEWRVYLDWAVYAFKVAANGVQDHTQIHTHMCYSEFNDIIESIAELDADVITIETSRSNMELLEAFEAFDYPNEIGPGVYDIHSPNVPSQEAILNLMHKAKQYIPASRLWINPDCGLKTRSWPEVKAALENMVQAAKILRASET